MQECQSTLKELQSQCTRLRQEIQQLRNPTSTERTHSPPVLAPTASNSAAQNCVTMLAPPPVFRGNPDHTQRFITQCPSFLHLQASQFHNEEEHLRKRILGCTYHHYTLALPEPRRLTVPRNSGPSINPRGYTIFQEPLIPQFSKPTSDPKHMFDSESKLQKGQSVKVEAPKTICCQTRFTRKEPKTIAEVSLGVANLSPDILDSLRCRQLLSGCSSRH